MACVIRSCLHTFINKSGEIVVYKYILVIIATVGMLFVSCLTPKSINYMQRPSEHIPDYPDTVGFKEYRLQKGDYINIRLYSLNEADLSLYNCNSSATNASSDLSADNPMGRLCLFIVDNDGNIDYPYIGEIAVAGKTLRDVKFELEEIFNKNIAKYISVDIALANRSFSIIGEGVSKRIAMPHDKITIFQALAMAGDLSDFADRSIVRLVRLTDRGTIVKKFDLRTEKIIDSEYYYIQPNDVLYIQPSGIKNVGIKHVSTMLSMAISTASIGIILYKVFNVAKSK